MKTSQQSSSGEVMIKCLFFEQKYRFPASETGGFAAFLKTGDQNICTSVRQKYALLNKIHF